MKWAPVVVWPILSSNTRRWGLVWLAACVGLSVVLLPLTIVQLQTLFGFGPRPIRLDYLVYLWAFIPWVYRWLDARSTVASRGRRVAVTEAR
jgi:hypothetical protein